MKAQQKKKVEKELEEVSYGAIFTNNIEKLSFFS